MKLRVRQDRIEADLQALAKFGATPEGGVTRLALTPEEEQAREYVQAAFQKAGLIISVDSIGNIFGRRPGRNPNAPALMLGSHVDSVINGGIFDGNAGVVAGLEVVRTLTDLGIETENPLEVAVFFAEESASFGKSCLGSRAFSGQLAPEQLKQFVNREGITLEAALKAKGRDPAKLNDAIRAPHTLAGYLELHIEQAENLSLANLPVGIVTGIAAATRLTVQVYGQAGHSGATPMGRRRDALCAAAEIILAVEDIASAQPQGTTVGTVGVVKASPGAINVIPGFAEVQIDIRDIYADSKKNTVAALRDKIAEIAARRKVAVEVAVTADDEPVATAPHLVELIKEAAVACNIPYQLMPSAAAHDAAYVAAIAPVGMIFVRSEGGSHNPKESAAYSDIALGTELLLEAVLRFCTKSA
ncbi:MAG: Zn-dependent hydrolase [bacterium]|jgi:N-carbamoyl-L-amino-acid hydrolase